MKAEGFSVYLQMDEFWKNENSTPQLVEKNRVKFGGYGEKHEETFGGGKTTL